jgi:hypothetical protein
MPGLILPSRLAQQPQQFVPLDRSNRIAAGALAVLTPTLDINWVTGKQLTRAGSGYALSALGGSQTLVHRQNNYVETELLPAIGTRSYIAFWVGYPIAVGVSSSSSEPAFVLGSSNNTVGICTTTGSNRSVSVGTGGTNNSLYWGGSNNAWPTIFGSSDGIPNIGATSGKPVVIMQVRNQASLDYWRDGVLVRSLPVGTSSIAAFKLISGAFVESASWYVSANMVLSGLIVLPSDPTPAELAAFSANTWGTLWNAQPRRLWSASASAGISGALSASLDGATFAASGQVIAQGAFASTLSGATFSASGTVGNSPSGTFASALAGASMAAAGNVTNTGAFASTLVGAAMVASGAVTNRGVFASTLDGATMSASGAVTANASGTFASTLDGATLAAGGYVGTPPAAPDFFIRLPKNPRHSLRH